MNFSAAHATSARPTLQDGAAERPPLVVFAATRWRFDWQRPQQLLTRLAKHYRVLYVEEPRTTHQDPWLECGEAAPGVEVLVAHTRCDARGFHDEQLPVVGRLLATFMRERGIARPLVWLDTPAPLPLAEALDPRGIVYDCHDDAAATSDDDILRHREARLMQLADVVVAGGPSLYQSHRGRHANVHCIANAVAATHFAPPAMSAKSIEAVSARAIHAAIPNPRLGFFGVIDERVDLDLLARMADLRPDWHFVMAGPLRGVAPEALPRRGNLTWLGAQTYAILPHLQAHWDVCLLPLKVDVCAHRAAPIEALEYLAGQKSVVSTPVHDVAALHGHTVRIADGAHAFVEACRVAMCERGPLRRQRRIDALIAVHSCTWERAAERVHRLLVEFAHEPAGLLVDVAPLRVAGAPHRDAYRASAN
ncbi:glycosyltransferase [Scleromatobacter humisilvae]|uniref:Glycosyltransferase n=1 Tax=Scleromatobacter humisilvae TaxID=2897159 RepID=A0A9X1YN59_9BURK|nr:glycosyltransferase [Scleromatobacter humisilvae]MCK9687457.1 glycosyltransferase [Scleromatobacter humisilvae]